MMEFKEYRGVYDSIYKQFELYLFRLFQLAKYVETFIKFTRISGPDLSKVLDPKGCDEVFVRIPPNPFIVNKNDWTLFKQLFEPFSTKDESEKSYRQLLIDIWERISEIKQWVGITKNTQFFGEPEANRRLVNEIDVFLRFPEACSSYHTLVLGKCPSDEKQKQSFIETLKQFKNFLLDREKHNTVKSYQNYC